MGAAVNPYSREGVRAILDAVREQPGRSTREIADALYWGHKSDISSANNILRTMAALGLIESRQAPPRHANTSPYRVWHPCEGVALVEACTAILGGTLQ